MDEHICDFRDIEYLFTALSKILPKKSKIENKIIRETYPCRNCPTCFQVPIRARSVTIFILKCQKQKVYDEFGSIE